MSHSWNQCQKWSAFSKKLEENLKFPKKEKRASRHERETGFFVPFFLLGATSLLRIPVYEILILVITNFMSIKKEVRG